MNDTIKRSDALAAVSLGATVMQLAAKIIAIPAATDPYQAEIARLLGENESWRKASDQIHASHLIHVENHATAVREWNAAEAKVAQLSSDLEAEKMQGSIAFQAGYEFAQATLLQPPTGVWPDFIAPAQYESPDPRWVDPSLPDFRTIWRVARERGYAIGLHGSMKSDCDLIAAPWTDDAVIAFDLIEHLCAALNAKIIGGISGKPHGRLGWILQIDGYVKHIDISVLPRAIDLTNAPRNERR